MAKDKFTYCDPAELRPDPANRKMGFEDMKGDDFDGLCASLAGPEGMINPIVITKGLLIVAGHQRHRAALRVGMQQVPVKVLDVADDDPLVSIIRRAENIFRREMTGTERIHQLRALIAEGVDLTENKGGRPKTSEISSRFSLFRLAKQLGLNPETINTAARTARDLIPEFVEVLGETKDKLQPWAANQLARMTAEDQRALYRAIGGNGVAGMTYAEARRLRNKVEELQQAVDNADERVKAANEELERYREAPAEAKRNDIVQNLKDKFEADLKAQLEKHDRDHQDELAKIKAQYEKNREQELERVRKNYDKVMRSGIPRLLENLRAYAHDDPEKVATEIPFLLPIISKRMAETCRLLAPWLGKFASHLEILHGSAARDARATSSAHLKPVS